jgi:hypothetical protein
MPAAHAPDLLPLILDFLKDHAFPPVGHAEHSDLRSFSEPLDISGNVLEYRAHEPI